MLYRKENEETHGGEIPGGPVVRILGFHCVQWSGFNHWYGKLRSCKLHSVAKKNTKQMQHGEWISQT